MKKLGDKNTPVLCHSEDRVNERSPIRNIWAHPFLCQFRCCLLPSLGHHLFLALLPLFLPHWEEPPSSSHMNSPVQMEAESYIELKIAKYRCIEISTARSSHLWHIHTCIHTAFVSGVGLRGGTDPTGRGGGVFKVVINWHREFSFKEMYSKTM